MTGMEGLSEENRAPVLNRMIEDYLARGGSEGADTLLLQAWMYLGVQYLARVAGRRAALDHLEDLHHAILHAQPGRPWRP